MLDELGLDAPGTVAIDTAASSAIEVGNKVSSDLVSPALSPSTQYGIQVDVDGQSRTI